MPYLLCFDWVASSCTVSRGHCVYWFLYGSDHYHQQLNSFISIRRLRRHHHQHHQSPNAAFFAMPLQTCRQTHFKAPDYRFKIVYYFLHSVVKSKKYALANPVYIDPVFTAMRHRREEKKICSHYKKRGIISEITYPKRRR